MTQWLHLAERHWPRLTSGAKTDTVRLNEGTVEPGFLVYVSSPSETEYAVVYVTDVRHIPLRDVLLYERGPEITPDEATLLEHLRAHYPEIELDTEIDFIQHLTVDDTRARFPDAITPILQERDAGWRRILLDEPWSFTLAEHADGLRLSVLAGTVGVYEVNIRLTDDEGARYADEGDAAIRALVADIVEHPDAYRERHISLREGP